MSEIGAAEEEEEGEEGQMSVSSHLPETSAA